MGLDTTVGDSVDVEAGAGTSDRPGRKWSFGRDSAVVASGCGSTAAGPSVHSYFSSAGSVEVLSSVVVVPCVSSCGSGTAVC